MCFEIIVIKKQFSVQSDKTLIVHGSRFPVNSVYLAACSPVFAAMFQNDMAEKTAKEVEIKGVSTAEHFSDFLAAISPDRVNPNRKHFLKN